MKQKIEEEKEKKGRLEDTIGDLRMLLVLAGAESERDEKGAR